MHVTLQILGPNMHATGKFEWNGDQSKADAQVGGPCCSANSKPLPPPSPRYDSFGETWALLGG